MFEVAGTCRRDQMELAPASAAGPSKANSFHLTWENRAQRLTSAKPSITPETPVSTDGETWRRAGYVLDFSGAAILDAVAQGLF